MPRPQLPEGLTHVRTTAVFDNTTAPAGLLRAHQVADGVWGRLLVRTGRVVLVFDDDPDRPIELRAGAAVAIPPARRHHVELPEPATFVVEFYRRPEEPSPAMGSESTGLLAREPGRHGEGS